MDPAVRHHRDVTAPSVDPTISGPLAGVRVVEGVLEGRRDVFGFRGRGLFDDDGQSGPTPRGLTLRRRARDPE